VPFKKPLLNFLFLSLISLLVVWLSVTAWELYRFVTSPIGTYQTAQAQVIEVQPGQSSSGLAQQLAQKGLMPHPKWLAWWMRWQGVDKRLRIGEYRIDPQWTPSELMQHLQKDSSVQYQITVVPGITFQQLWQQVRALPKLPHQSDLTPEKLAKTLGVKQLEGWFLPETYAYQKWGDSDLKLFKRMHLAMKKTLDAAWEKREKNLPLKSPYEVLILASIVEKETGQASERPLIAGVFINRLRKRMRLQSDPTVIYGMGELYQGNIRKKDLRTKTAYNTYRINGLPPTPICLPSQSAIEAVVHPAKTQALYFVGKGDGTHQFSNSLKQHNRAVYQYQKKRH